MTRIPATHAGIGPDGAEILRPIIVVAIEIGGRAFVSPLSRMGMGAPVQYRERMTPIIDLVQLQPLVEPQLRHL